MQAACTFHLVRHAHHSLLGNTLAGRTPGVALSTEGGTQAEALAQHFRHSPARAVVSGPADRARQTAAPIAAALNLAPQTDSAFDEIDFGDWTGRSFKALSLVAEWDAWNDARSLALTPGGETMLAVQARAIAGLMALRVVGGAVVVVSHGDVIKAILAYALGMPLDLLHRLEVAPASRSTLVLGASFAQVLAVNLAVS